MSTRAPKSRPSWLALGLLGSLAGCAQSGPMTQHRVTLSGLKANVVQLESEKDQLRKQVAELQTENHRMEDRLAQEEAANGELATRLDDARNLIRDGGGNAESLAGNRSRPTPRRTTPVRGNSRRAPFAEIRGDLRSASPPDDDPYDDDGPQSGRDDDGPQWSRARR